VWDGGPFLDFTIPGNWLGAPHIYRIDWNPESVAFFIDGALVHSEPAAIGGPMRIGASDFDPNGIGLAVDWARLAPYSATGVFTSRVLDAGTFVAWDAVAWSESVPAGTSLALETRTGNAPSPDGTWSAWALAPSSGSPVGLASRYIQYRASLSTSEPFVTPALRDLAVTCSSAPVGAGDAALAAPLATKLHAVFPNPFARATRISFDLALRGRVSLRVFAVDGRVVRTIEEGEREPGRYTGTWDGCDDAGRAVAAGVYFVRLDAPGFTRTNKMLLLR
jgi:hypothetical protein